MNTRQLFAAMTVLIMTTIWATETVLAEPPPWAPAHGYRAKHKSKGKKHVTAAPVAALVNIDLGTCNRDVVGALLGGAAGGALGSSIGSGSGKTVAIIGGTIIGAIVGGSIGRRMDEIDQNCVGQALERASDGQKITWHGNSQETYTVTPTKTYQGANGTYCREYNTEATIGGKQQTIYGQACRQPDGSWKLGS
ncbi:MAG: glycine zipper domain-containing protein [Alphaproteobacteria bacterium]